MEQARPVLDLQGQRVGGILMTNIIIRKETDLPAQSCLMSEEEFLDRTGLPRERLVELLQLDWLHFVRTQQTLLFQEDDIARVRKLERLCCDFELPVVGGTIVVELLDRISELEREIRHLRRLI